MRILHATLMAAAVAAPAVLWCSTARTAEPMQVGFLWHMHQPIYYPGKTITETDAAGHFSFSITDVHNQRLGPYTGWPRDAIQAGLGLPHLGAQVSFSGSLIQNLNVLESAGVNGGQWNNWDAGYRQAAQWDTSLGNPRLDLVNFGFNHPLMPLLDTRDMQMQIKLQKRIHEQTWGPGVPFSKGIFPPESAFSTRIIPALVAEGIEWSIVDSIHLERATVGYPHTNASNLYAPNRADQMNPDIAASGGQWVQLNDVWAPSKVAANGSRHLYAAVNGDTLYVATEDAGEGNDVFIYLADAPGSLANANWAKAGQIAQWDAFLADENDNDYEAWTGATGTSQAATGTNGGVLEGIINLAQQFGSLPAQVYLAVGVYPTANGGALVTSQQVPASVIANGSIEAVEYFLLQLVVTPGDFDRNGVVDEADYGVWRSTFGSAGDLRADGNGDGKVDTADYVVWRNNLGASASGAYLLTRVDQPNIVAVPEPATFVLVWIAAILFWPRRRKLASVRRKR
jgi:hypothetical protein